MEYKKSSEEFSSIPLSKSYTILSNKKNPEDFSDSEKPKVFLNGKISKKRLLDALACLEADLKFLQEEIKKSNGISEYKKSPEGISSIEKSNLVREESK